MIEKIIQWNEKRKAVKSLLKKYIRDLSIDEILKDWTTECILLRKQEGRRKELIELQNKIKEEQLFIKWLKAIK